MQVLTTYRAHRGVEIDKQWRAAAESFDSTFPHTAQVCDTLYVSVDGAPGATRLAVLTSGSLWLIDQSGHQTKVPLIAGSSVTTGDGVVTVTAADHVVEIRGRGAEEIVEPIRERLGRDDLQTSETSVAHTGTGMSGRRLADIPSEVLVRIEVVGGAGPFGPVRIGDRIDLSFRPDTLMLLDRSGRTQSSIPYEVLSDIVIGGPGETSTGGGFIGGGFGVEGAMIGMAAGAILNQLTTRTSITTIIAIAAPGAELYGLHTTTTPEDLRLLLSPVFAARTGPATWAGHDSE